MKRVLVNAAIVITALASLATPVAYSLQVHAAESTPAATFATKSTSHAGISLSYDTALASSVWGEVLPRLVTEDGPIWENLPQHVRFLLNSYPVPREFWTPNVSVFPVQELLRDQPLVESDVNTLRTLIARRPNLRSQYPLVLTDRPGTTPPPYVPPINAGQVVSLKMEYVNFANGSGIRYLTYLAQDLSPISSNELLYVYQGLTSDGNSYVSVIVPVESTIQRDAPPLDGEQILAYNRDMAQRLDRASNADFTPNLTLLDDMVRSIRVGPAPPVPTTSYTFPETGFAVSGRIWQAWLGGRQYDYSLYINGYPISELRSETSPTDGKIYQTQWFERARFELHPENKAPFDVLLGLLGVVSAQGRESAAPFQPVDAPEDFMPWFPETRHTLGDSSEGGQAISQWWIRLGGLPQFGYPISQPFMETSREDGKEYLVQYFERQRFEYHPEKKGTEYEVLLGRLGAEQMK